jgi:DNA-binding response OmpR family regulator
VRETIKVLMIDDEAALCNAVKANLEAAGDCEVEFATRGAKGLQLAQKFKPDVILLDIVMPEMDGFEVLTQLKKDSRTLAIPVIMLSARTDEISKRTASQLFDEDYIEKPVSMQVLRQRIEAVLARYGKGPAGQGGRGGASA